MPVRVRSVALGAAMIAVSFAALAQSYPDKPVKIIVPIGPGGSYDIVGRTVADQLGKRLGQSVVVENKPGAGTVVGTQFVAGQPADGYTLLVGGLSNIVFNPSLYSKLGHDPMKEFTPITLVLGISYVLVGRKDLPYSTLAEVIDAARKEPGKLSMANAGNRHRPASGGGGADECDRREIPGSALQGRAARLSGYPLRARRLLHRFLSGRSAAYQGRQCACHRDRRPEAQSADAGRSDHGGSPA